MDKPYWQPYWWRLLFRADGDPEWAPLGPPPLTQVPNSALKETSLEAWADALLEQAPGELDDLRGELRLECYDVPEPADGTPPVYSLQIRLPGNGRAPGQ